MEINETFKLAGRTHRNDFALYRVSCDRHDVAKGNKQDEANYVDRCKHIDVNDCLLNK